MSNDTCWQASDLTAAGLAAGLIGGNQFATIISILCVCLIMGSSDHLYASDFVGKLPFLGKQPWLWLPILIQIVQTTLIVLATYGAQVQSADLWGSHLYYTYSWGGYCLSDLLAVSIDVLLLWYIGKLRANAKRSKMDTTFRHMQTRYLYQAVVCVVLSIATAVIVSSLIFTGNDPDYLW
eukprot:jgi/Hompol1/3405/HPOL_006515-RA